MPSTTVDPQPALLHAAQMDYFRVHPHNWALVLVRLRQMGADTVIVPLYWGWHEFQDNHFDLTGQTDPRRNLVRFITLCRQMRFRLIVQVGPSLFDGVLGNGVPTWLLKRYPAILACHADGTNRLAGDPGQPTPSPLHPLYLEYVRRWYEKIVEPVALNSHQQGISFVQVSIDVLDQDYNPTVTDTLWPIWLRKEYKTIEALNAVLSTSYSTFSQVAPKQFSSTSAFADWYRAYAQSTYIKMLQTAGWIAPAYVLQPADLDTRPPIHYLQTSDIDRLPVAIISPAVEASPDFPDIGTSLHWGEDAPIRSTGRQKTQFWQIKAQLDRLVGNRTSGTPAPTDAHEPGSPEAEQAGILTRLEDQDHWVYQHTMLQDVVHLAEALCRELSDVELVATDTADAPSPPIQNVLSEAVISLDRASRYASKLRATLEGRPEAQAAGRTSVRIRLTSDALKHLTTLLDEVTAARADLKKAAPPQLVAMPNRNQTLHTVSDIVSRLSRHLCVIRTDLQAGEIELESGVHIERMLAGLLQALLNTLDILSETT